MSRYTIDQPLSEGEARTLAHSFRSYIGIAVAVAPALPGCWGLIATDTRQGQPPCQRILIDYGQVLAYREHLHRQSMSFPAPFVHAPLSGR